MVSSTLAIGQFYGQVRRRVEVGGITLTETRYAPGFRVPTHDHVHPSLLFVLSGTLVEDAEGEPKRTVGPLGVVYHPVRMAHSAEFGAVGRSRLFNVELGPAWLGRLADYGLTPPDRKVSVGQGKLSWMVGHLYREYLTRDPAARLAVDGLALATLAELLRLPAQPVRGRRPAWLDRMVDLLHARYADPPSLAELAAEAGVHPMHLTRACRHFLGCSVGELVRRIRIDEACRLIAEGEPLARVAHSTGFADQSHFSKTFARLIGMAPGRYRRRLTG